MRSSSNSRLAGGPIAHDGGDDVAPPAALIRPPEESDSANTDFSDRAEAMADRRTRPDPQPGSRAHARVGIAPAPEGVSEHSWQRLAVHVSRALGSSTTRGASLLRPSVNIVVAEMRLAAAPWDVIEQAVIGAVTTHPDFGANDRLNVVSGKRSSAALIARVVGWVHRARQVEGGTELAGRASSSDRIDVEKAESVLAALQPVLDRHLAEGPRTDATRADALDQALSRSVMELRFTLNEQTFEYLRWRVASTRDELWPHAVTTSRPRSKRST
ncbi:MAG: hypothetical protein ABI601_16275 [bacterium]